MNFVAEKLGAEIIRTTQSSSKFLSCIQEICLDLYKFIDFETFVGDMRVLITYSSPMFVRIFEVLGKAVQRFFFTKNKAVKDDPNVYLELHFWCNTKLKSRLNLRLLPCFKFFLMVKGHESGGERVHPPHPPAFGIWQSIINPNSFIHSFIPSIKN